MTMTKFEIAKSLAGATLYINTPNELKKHLLGRTPEQIEAAMHLIKIEGFLSIEIKGETKTTTTLIIYKKPK